jgi:hypothetical protein
MALRQPVEPNSQPVETEMREGFSKLAAIRALHLAIVANFTAASWAEVGVVVGMAPLVTLHRRLLRSLEWNDPDYEDVAKDVLLKLLGPNFENLNALETYVGLKVWLGNNDPTLFRQLYEGEPPEQATPATQPPNPAGNWRPAPTPAVSTPDEPEHDVFISHAWEDKASFVRALAERLRAAGLKVWYDNFEFKIGDGLRRTIDQGLARSRFGVVVLSPDFFAKHWPQEELEGLSAKETADHKVILPVWHNITKPEVARFSPTLAGRLAANSKDGMDRVVADILANIRPSHAGATPPDRASVTPQLIAFGPDIVTMGMVVGMEPRLWTIRVDEFLEGDISRLIKYCEGFEALAAEQRYVLVGALGDGRKLSAAMSITAEGGCYLVRCPIEPSFVRTPIQHLPASWEESPETNDIFARNGQIARVAGVEVFPQRLRGALSMLRGESPMHLNYGSRLQEYYWCFRNSDLLTAMLALDVIRMASIPYDLSTPSHTPLFCVEQVWSVTPLLTEPENGRLPMRLDISLHGMGRGQYEVNVLMPDAEKTRELSAKGAAYARAIGLPVKAC